MDFYAYMLRGADGSYYVGHTNDLEARVAQHQGGEAPSYTQARRPVQLVWRELFPTRDEAFAAERQIKGWSRAKKEALIAGTGSGSARLPKELQQKQYLPRGGTSIRRFDKLSGYSG